MVEISDLWKKVPLSALFTGSIWKTVVILHHFGDYTPFFNFLFFSEMFKDFVFLWGPEVSLSHYKLITYPQV